MTYTYIYQLAEACLKAGLSDDAMLAAIRMQFPHSNTTLNSPRWYRSRYNRLGCCN